MLAAGLFLLIFVGCGKDPESDNPPAVQKPDLTYTVTEDNSGEIKAIKLDWNATRATSCTLNGDTVALSGSKTTDIVENTLFTFVVVGEGGSIEKKVEVKAYLPIITLTADPDTLPIGGGTTTISWTSQNTDSVLIEGVWYGPNGSIQIERDITSEISALAKGKGGENTSSLSVCVLTMDNLLASGTRTYVKGEFYDTLGVLMYAFFEYENENSLPCQKDDTRTFTMNPNISILDFGVQCGENITTYPETWSLNDSILTIGNSIVEIKIVILTEDVLVYTIPSCSYVGDKVIPIVAKYTYKNLP